MKYTGWMIASIRMQTIAMTTVVLKIIRIIAIGRKRRAAAANSQSVNADVVRGEGREGGEGTKEREDLDIQLILGKGCERKGNHRITTTD